MTIIKDLKVNDIFQYTPQGNEWMIDKTNGIHVTIRNIGNGKWDIISVRDLQIKVDRYAKRNN